MTEIQNILRAIHEIDLDKQQAAVATLVKVHGSSYRRPGARMVISSDGKWAGAISGGCLEGDVLLRAQRIIQQGKPTVVRYDTTNDDANIFGVGLGCNGIIDIVIEPFSSHQDSCVQCLQSLASPKQNIVHAVVFASSDEALPIGTRWIVEQDEVLPTDIPAAVASDCRTALHNGVSATHIYATEVGSIEVFIEVVQPQTRCLIFGAGHDALPLVRLASLLGWHITVTDKSPAKAQHINFPQADAVHCLQPQLVSQHLPLDKHTVCIFVTHNFDYDVEVLKQLLNTEVRYIGILGPRKRWQKMQEELCKQGIALSEQNLERIYSPVGLDIGAERPEEIALSIIAEVQNVLQKGSGESLRDKSGTIHRREKL